MKKLVLAGLFLIMAADFVFAQKAELLVKSSDKGLYLEHKVVPKESFYAVGRLYNISPRAIASFNNMDLNKGLFIDQKIKIPLTDTNFKQSGNSGTPVYYKVKDKDNLSKISAAMNNVPVSNLRQWNNLAGDEIKEGTKLVVGFLMSKEMPSTIINNNPIPETPVEKTEEKIVIKEEVKPVIKEEIKPLPREEIKEEIKPEQKPLIIKEEKTGTGDEGYFRSSFDQQVRITPAIKNETVTSGIFKTTSGWGDMKYYLLMDGLPPGTIVKIMNPENNKAVYAKVLGEMSGIRQNAGLNIRISNAAASALQIHEEDKFIVKLNY